MKRTPITPNMVREVLHLLAATQATEPQLPERVRIRLQAQVKRCYPSRGTDDRQTAGMEVQS